MSPSSDPYRTSQKLGAGARQTEARALMETARTLADAQNNMDDISASLIVDEIKSSIDNFEPRVDLIDVKAFPNFDNNQFDVIITYNIIGAELPPQELQFALQSTR